MKYEAYITVLNLEGESEQYFKDLKSTTIAGLKKELKKIAEDGVLVIKEGKPTKYYPAHRVGSILVLPYKKN